MNERETGTHLSHCNLGEYIGSCKYGDFDSCPALIAPHPNCKSELHVIPPVTMTMTYRPPTAKELTLEIMQLEMRQFNTHWWQVFKRFAIRLEIRRCIITALAFGYYKTKK